MSFGHPLCHMDIFVVVLESEIDWVGLRVGGRRICGSAGLGGHVERKARREREKRKRETRRRRGEGWKTRTRRKIAADESARRKKRL